MRNQILLLIMTIALVSCGQEQSIAKKGHFTNLGLSQNSRVPASIANGSKSFKKFSTFQDTKQIYIHCQLNSKNTDFCYQNKLKETLTSFTKVNKSVDSTSMEHIKEYNRIDYIREKMQEIDKKLVRTINEKIMATVTLRSKFCKANAKKRVQKCLNRFIKKDAFNIVNDYQRKTTQKLNGSEYLYLKNLAYKRLTNQFVLEAIKIKRNKRNTKKSI